MIVRILNRKTDRDKFFDCRNSCLRKVKRIADVTNKITEDTEELSLILEFKSDSVIEVVLDAGDEIYYMNNNGKTVHADYRLLNK